MVFKYYARKPVTGLEQIREQLNLGHRYRNSLVELELERRRRYQEITDSLVTPDIKVLEEAAAEFTQEIETLTGEISNRNKAARRRTGTAEERAKLKEWRLAYRGLHKVIKEMRTKLKPAAKSRYDELNDWMRVKQKQLRHASGLFWSNYLEIEKSVNPSGPPPRFHRYTGEGKVAIQIQKGMTPEEAFACEDLRFRIKRPPDEAFADAQTSKSRRLCRTMAEVRIGSDEKGHPLWAQIPVLMHRLPPEDAVIKWVFITRRRVRGTQERWQLQLVLERAAGWAAPDCAENGAVGVDLGWRTFDDRLRVAYWVGSDHSSGELSLPVDLIDRWTYAESIQSIRAKRFETARNMLADWLHDHEGDDNDDQMNWIRENSKNIRQWRSEGRLATFIRRWSDVDGPIPGNIAMIIGLMRQWRKQELHLLRLESSLRETAVETRNELYRRFAAQLRRKYATIKVEQWNIHKSIRLPSAEAESSNAASRVYQRIAAVGLLRLYLTAKARHTVKVDPANTTKKCAICGTVDEWDAAAHLFHKCSQCDTRWDQDRNAAVNILNAEPAGGRSAP